MKSTKRRVFKIKDPQTGLYWNNAAYGHVSFEKVGYEYKTRAAAERRYIDLIWTISAPPNGPEATEARLAILAMMHPKRVRRSQAEMPGFKSPDLPPPKSLIRIDWRQLVIEEIDIVETPLATSDCAALHEKAKRLALATATHGRGSLVGFIKKLLISDSKQNYTHIIELQNYFYTATTIERQLPTDVREKLNRLDIPNKQMIIQDNLIAVQGDTAMMAARMADLPIISITELATMKISTFTNSANEL